jgi:hypothetical protein
MRNPTRTLSITLGLATLVGAATLRADDPANPPSAAGVTSSLQTALPAGFQTKDLGEQNDVRKTLASITSHAITKDHFNDLCDDLTKQDKDRIGKYQDRDTTKLNGRVDQINKAWKEKYGKDFDFDNEKVVFNDQYTIIQGEVSDPTIALSNWPVPAMSNEAMKASQTQRPSNTPEAAKDKDQAADDAKLEKGRNVAIVRFPAGHDAPELCVSLIHQLPDNWKIDVPNDRSGQEIYNDLLTQLTWLGDHSAQWPANQDDAYRMFSHHIMAALYGAQPMMNGTSETK